MIIPPDGGFGWWIMVLSFFSQVIVDGIIFSIGILLPEISKEFGIPISEAVLVASVQIGSYFTFGAIASALINRFGFRPVAIFGVLASAMTIMAASFVNSAVLLVALYSAVGGCTLSMIWVSSQLIVGYYFERYRPIANGFSCSGAGAGIFIFAFLTNYLLPIIGWRNVLRMQVGFLLLILFMSIAYVEVPPTPVGVYNREVDESSSEEYYGNFYVQDFMRFSKESSYSKTRSLMSVYEPPKKRRCAKCCSCCRVKKKDSEPHSFEEKTLIIKPTPMQREDLFYTGPADYDEPHSKENVDGKDIYLIGNTRSTKQANYAIHHIQKSDDPGKKSAAASRHTLDYRHQPKKRSCMDNMFVKALFRLFDFHLLKQFEFRVLVASAFLFPMGMNIPFVYSKARVTISKEYAYFITPAIGLSNFAVRIVCGFIAYKKRELDTLVCGGGLAFGGLVVLGSAFYGTDLVWFQIFYGLCYGVAPAVYSTLRALIYVRYLGLSKLTNAFGITALAMGLGVFMGTTISGMMVSITKDYVVPFAFAGVCLIVSGSLKLLLPSLVKARKRKKGAK
ncbi:monocarboxylate transporter 9 isoform X2 [Drosophila bipectinata]